MLHLSCFTNKQINCTSRKYPVSITCDAELPPVWIPDALNKKFQFILRCLDLNWDLAVYAVSLKSRALLYMCLYRSWFQEPRLKIKNWYGYLISEKFLSPSSKFPVFIALYRWSCLLVWLQGSVNWDYSSYPQLSHWLPIEFWANLTLFPPTLSQIPQQTVGNAKYQNCCQA